MSDELPASFFIFLTTVTALELAAMRHDAKGVGDITTLKAVDAEFRRRELALAVRGCGR